MARLILKTSLVLQTKKNKPYLEQVPQRLQGHARAEAADGDAKVVVLSSVYKVGCTWGVRLRRLGALAAHNNHDPTYHALGEANLPEPDHEGLLVPRLRVCAARNRHVTSSAVSDTKAQTATTKHACTKTPNLDQRAHTHALTTHPRR